MSVVPSPKTRPRRALVLGNRGVASLIQRALEESGFETHLEADRRMPGFPSSPQAWQDLRSLIAEFLQEAATGQRPPLQCVHPGTTAWAERAELPVIGQEMGFEVIGSSPRTLSLFGNRLALMGEAESLKIPNLLLTPDPLHGVGEIERLFRGANHGNPFVLKTIRGGSTFGVRVIQSEEDLGRPLSLWLEQLRRNLGEVMLLAERYLEGSRRFVVPFARLADGHLELFPISDASLQCRFRKTAQFCPAVQLDEPIEKQMRELTSRLAERTGFLGVGSLEYLVDGTKAYLIEGMARLNTDFHLWETIAGTRAVAWQLASMEGRDAVRGRKPADGEKHAFGVALRLHAEDSTLQLPQPGVLREAGEKRIWDLPGAKAELTLSLRPGEEISPLGHGFVGHLWAFGRDPQRALAVAQGALDEIWLAGSLQVNDRFLADLLSHPWVQEGIFHAGFVDEEFIPSIRPPVDVLKLFPAVCASHPAVQADSAPSRWAVGDQWVRLDPALARWVQGPEFWEEDGKPGVSGWVQGPEGSPPKLRVCAYPLPSGDGRWQVRIGKWVFAVRRVLTPVEKRKPTARLLALVSGRVHSLLFREGATAAAHEPLLVVESLGMLVPHALPVDVTIQRWKCARDELVQAGQELASLSNS